MLFRINLKNFLLHMIDYFTVEELLGFQYVVLSAGIAVHGSSKENVVKLHAVYPSSELTDRYLDDHDEDIFRRTWYAELKQIPEVVFVNLVQPIVEYHHNYLMINLEKEDLYTEVVADYILKEFGLPCVDLNELFLTGETELFTIDRKELHDRNVKLARSIAKSQLLGYESTDEGKLHLIKDVMGEKDKLAKLKELGIKRLKPADYKRLDELLIEAWLENPPGS